MHHTALLCIFDTSIDEAAVATECDARFYGHASRVCGFRRRKRPSAWRITAHHSAVRICGVKRESIRIASKRGPTSGESRCTREKAMG